ncbi:hypothetical protein H8356DRAFT_1336499 [Neocallimastix lanati (nom. inval.)]|nr:hypothetical protein H8356DRAFT_1336499 [Neocallimastix sp. JGI-2020a]
MTKLFGEFTSLLLTLNHETLLSGKGPYGTQLSGFCPRRSKLLNIAQHFITLFVTSYWAYTDNTSALQLQVQLLFIHVNRIMIAKIANCLEIRYVTKGLSLDRLEVTIELEPKAYFITSLLLTLNHETL